MLRRGVLHRELRPPLAPSLPFRRRLHCAEPPVPATQPPAAVTVSAATGPTAHPSSERATLAALGEAAKPRQRRFGRVSLLLAARSARLCQRLGLVDQRLAEFIEEIEAFI